MSPLCVARRSVLVSVALLWPVLAYAIDVDWDGIDDALDNCPSLWNAGQLNSDGDAHGDRCDDDDDNDGIFDDADNCTIYPNGDQYDSNADGFGNRCDGDLNGSLTVNLADQFLFNEAFALSPEPEPLVLDADCNHDYVVGAPDIPCFMAELEKKFPGPSWTSDTDGGGPDGVKDYADNCVGVANPEQEDSDADGLGDACDEDDDGDGVADDADNCLGRPNPLQQDTNADGFGNACDPDWTNDGSVGSLDYALVGVHFGHQQRDALDFDISTDGSGGVGAPSLALVNQY